MGDQQQPVTDPTKVPPAAVPGVDVTDPNAPAAMPAEGGVMPGVDQSATTEMPAPGGVMPPPPVVPGAMPEPVAPVVQPGAPVVPDLQKVPPTGVAQ